MSLILNYSVSGNFHSLIRFRKTHYLPIYNYEKFLYDGKILSKSSLSQGT